MTKEISIVLILQTEQEPTEPSLQWDWQINGQSVKRTAIKFKMQEEG